MIITTANTFSNIGFSFTSGLSTSFCIYFINLSSSKFKLCSKVALNNFFIFITN
ncbi:hypothetical protein EFW11_1074 [Enterococcus faecalis]|nr:hypothetical protein EFW11_1074 [Enterococcus faecalis]